jgi:hypothetical protein
MIEFFPVFISVIDDWCYNIAPAGHFVKSGTMKIYRRTAGKQRGSLKKGGSGDIL